MAPANETLMDCFMDPPVQGQGQGQGLPEELDARAETAFRTAPTRRVLLQNFMAPAARLAMKWREPIRKTPISGITDMNAPAMTIDWSVV